jgi:hypothetical protein
MALPGVSIALDNGAIGLLPDSQDGLVGMLLQSAVAPSGLALLTPRQITSLAEAEGLGITASFDTTNTVRCYKHIADFYRVAPTGTPLWIMFVSNAVTMSTMVDKTQANYAVKLLEAAGGEIRMLVVTRSPAGGFTANTVANQVDIDVVNALPNAQGLAAEFFSRFTPIRVIIEGIYFTGNSGTLVNLKTFSHNAVAVMIGDTATGNGAAVGLLAGVLATVPVQRNVGRVKSGALPISAAYLGTATLESFGASNATIHDKGFITVRKYAGRSGYYFSDDPTATVATDDYNSVARGRIIDKVARIAYQIYVNEILDEILVEPTTGNIETAKAKYYQSIIENAVDGAMTAEGEIAAFNAFVDPTVNILSTGKLTVECRIVPLGYAKAIDVTLGFSNPANG